MSCAADDVPALVTEALEPGAPVLVEPTLTDAAAPFVPFVPLEPLAPRAPVGPAGPAGPRTFHTIREYPLGHLALRNRAPVRLFSHARIVDVFEERESWEEAAA